MVATVIRSVPLLGATRQKSTRLNSSHQIISYAVFCLKKKSEIIHNPWEGNLLLKHSPKAETTQTHYK